MHHWHPKPQTHTGTRSHDAPVYAGDVDDEVDHITAELVGLHVDRRAVGGDVDLAHNIEQERFLDSRILKQINSSHIYERKSYVRAYMRVYVRTRTNVMWKSRNTSSDKTRWRSYSDEDVEQVLERR